MLHAILVFSRRCSAPSIAGLFGRAIGDRGAQIVTCGGCWSLAALCVVRSSSTSASASQRARSCRSPPGSPSAASSVDWALRLDTLSAVMLFVVTIVSSLVHVYSVGYMAARPEHPALHGLSVAVHLRHADAGDGRQPRAAVLRLGRRGPRVLPADRLLVRPAVGQRRGDQGLHRQPGRRFRLRARHLRAFCMLRHASQFDDDLRQARRTMAEHDAARSSATTCRRSTDRLPAAVRRRHGQVGAARPAHLAAGRHGRPDAGLGADPRRDHGDRRRLHGLPAVAAVRVRADGARRRHLHRRLDRVLRRHRRPDAERHQAGDRLFDLLAARLHVLRRRRRRLSGRHVPPLHPRLLQGAAVPRRRLGDPRHVRRAGHAPDGRHLEQDPARPTR